MIEKFKKHIALFLEAHSYVVAFFGYTRGLTTDAEGWTKQS